MTALATAILLAAIVTPMVPLYVIAPGLSYSYGSFAALMLLMTTVEVGR